MKNIVIAGASVYGLNNLSDDAMFTVFCRELHKNVPQADITLLARHPSKQLDDFHQIKSIKNLDHDAKSESIGRWFNGLNPGDSTRHLRGIWDKIAAADLLILGGEPFIDITIGLYKGLAPYASLLVTLAKLLEKPIMIHGIHIGRPLETDLGKEMAKFCISNANLVTIREEQSRQMIKDMGVQNTDHIITLADTAYGLDRVSDMQKGFEILKKEKISFTSDKIIGVTFRYMYWKWKEADREYYSNEMAELCDYMVESLGADVLFIPHCTYDLDHYYEDDRPGAKEIIKKMKNQERAFSIQGRYNIYDTLSLFPHLSMIFSNRRHSLIFGAIHDVPGLGIGEVGHVRPVMEQLLIGGERFVSIEEFNSRIVSEKLTEIWNDRNMIKDNMRKALPALREKALSHAKLAAELIS